MSFLKAKTILNDECRLFNRDCVDIKDGYQKLLDFVRVNFKLEGKFKIQYKDEDDDLITIGSAQELETAYADARQNKTTLRLLVAPEAIGVPVYSFTTEVEEVPLKAESAKVADDRSKILSSENENLEEEEEEEVDEKNDLCCADWQQFVESLKKDDELRQELQSMVTTFVVCVQSAPAEATVSSSFSNALNMHPKLAALDCVKKFNAQLPQLEAQHPMEVAMLKANTPMIQMMLPMLMQALQQNQANPFPMGNLFGGMFPMFGGMMGNAMQQSGFAAQGCPFAFAPKKCAKKEAKQEKLMKKMAKQQKKRDRKRDNLLAKKAKLTQQLKQLEEELQKVEEEEKEKQASALIAVSAEEEEVNAPVPVDEHVMPMIPQLLQDVAGPAQADNVKRVDVVESEDMDIEEIYVNEEHAPVEQLPAFEYQEQLDQLKAMGFYDLGLLKVLLVEHKGNVEAALGHLF